jgi:hypothetical protein
MKRISVILLLFVISGCNEIKHEESKEHQAAKKDTSDAFRELLKKEEKLKTLKDIEEYKLAFLEGTIDKPLRILGTPDDEMISTTVLRGAYIWYDKVKKNNEIRHLAIEFGTEGSEQIALQVLPVVDSSYFYSTRMDKVFIKKP